MGTPSFEEREALRDECEELRGRLERVSVAFRRALDYIGDDSRFAHDLAIVLDADGIELDGEI